MIEIFEASPVAAIIFVLTILTTLYGFSNDVAQNNMILHPYSVHRKKNMYTLITSGFIHNDWMHLLFNMYSFYFFAFDLERVIGHWQFGLLYMVSLVASDLPTVYKHRDDYYYRSLGASGAISAVIFSAILYSPKSTMMILPIPIEIPAYIFGVLYLVYCTYASKYSQDRINHDAHLYGALSGIAITLILNPSVLRSFLGAFGIG